MYLKHTAEDLNKILPEHRAKVLVDWTDEYRASAWFKIACQAERYSKGFNDILHDRHKMVMRPVTYTDGETGVTKKTGELKPYDGNLVTTNIYGRLITQRVQYLFQNGLNLDDDKKQQLGAEFDAQMEAAAKWATIHGESYVFWDFDGVVAYKAASDDELSGMYTVIDEITSQPVLAVRFWQIENHQKWFMQVYDTEGTELYEVKEGTETLLKKTGYFTESRVDAISIVTTEKGYGRFPIAVFKAADDGRSSFTPSIKSKIDMYDKIVSDLGDNLERMEGIYWVIKNFYGNAYEARAMLAELEQLRTAIGHDDGQEAHPEAIEAPYQARQYALDLLEAAINRDMLALDLHELTGGSLTNVAILAAKANLDMATNELETQAFKAYMQVLKICGHDEFYPLTAKYRRQTIGNETETVNMVYTSGLRNDITREAALRLTGLFEADEIETILNDMDAEEVTGIDSTEKLMQLTNGGGDK